MCTFVKKEKELEKNRGRDYNKKPNILEKCTWIYIEIKEKQGQTGEITETGDKNMNITMNNSYILLDIQRLRENTGAILEELPSGTALIPVLKDDAYGLGVGAVLPVLQEFPAIQCIAVSHVAEGVELRKLGWQGEVLVMGGTMTFLFPLTVEHDLTVAAGRLDMIPKLAQIGREQGRRVRVQVKIETGLHRIGVLPGEELEELAAELNNARDVVQVTGAFTHFSKLSDPELTQRQYEAFMAGTTRLEELGIPVPMRHAAGSAAWEQYPQYALDGVRLGRRLYMDHPTEPTGRIQEVASWRTYITNIRSLKAGDELGYGGACVLERDAVAATIGVGYGDGLNMDLADCRAPVLVGGKRARLLACCMDQAMIDVTGIDCRVDDEVTMFGWDSGGNYLSSQEVALLIGENEGCGLISDLSPRVIRVQSESV